MGKKKQSKTKASHEDNLCGNCGGVIHVMAYRMTGVCSGNCRKTLEEKAAESCSQA